MREKTEKEREEGKMEKDKQIQNQIHVRGMMDRRRRKLGKERNGGEKQECNQIRIIDTRGFFFSFTY